MFFMKRPQDNALYLTNDELTNVKYACHFIKCFSNNVINP